VATLSALTGSSKPCVCRRLARLEQGALTGGPRCIVKMRWDLSEQGKVVAAATAPAPIDNLDKRILRTIARTPLRLVSLARLTGSCDLTIRRRADRLAERGLIAIDDAKRFTVATAGREALGPDEPAPWLKPEAVSAAMARDVQPRLARPGGDRSHSALPEHVKLVRQAGESDDGGKSNIFRARFFAERGHRLTQPPCKNVSVRRFRAPMTLCANAYAARQPN
jgi:hypothetical protein